MCTICRVRWDECWGGAAFIGRVPSPRTARAGCEIGGGAGGGRTGEGDWLLPLLDRCCGVTGPTQEDPLCNYVRWTGGVYLLGDMLLVRWCGGWCQALRGVIGTALPGVIRREHVSVDVGDRFAAVSLCAIWRAWTDWASGWRSHTGRHMRDQSPEVGGGWPARALSCPGATARPGLRNRTFVC